MSSNYLEQVFVDIVNSAAKSAAAAQDFLVSEVPQVVQQLLVWHYYYYLILFFASLVILIMWAVIDFKIYKWIKARGRYHDLWDVYIVGGSLVRFIIIAFFAALVNLKWLKILIAPKLYLLEYAVSLVK